MLAISPEIAAALKQERQRIARAGGKARAKNMSAKERRASALKASQAAAKARSAKARQKKRDTLGKND